ncbi:hypothetical protein INT43_002379 [Umbelopsis isabellina]|uniref:Protein phosphatase methylesterase 1 n=1 Tax=Mortierella isabellina TaxID=91625 RepID=A0A8H7Q728_MORIS|nr:hypothetical protein INT43_002379 [Umbelopsis isabellina]
MSSLQKDLFKSQLPPLEALQEDPNSTSDVQPEARSEQHQFALPKRQLRDYSPLTWNEYFDTRDDIEIHGKTKDGKVPPVFVMHHGAGHSGLSYGLTAKRIRTITNSECSILAYDCRDHGSTKTLNDLDLSLATMSDDLCKLIEHIYGEQKPDIILVGHSMGGAVIVDAANQRRIPNLLGVVVLDVVEGSALEALSSMSAFLNNRPSQFETVQDAIKWGVKSGTVHTLESARLSFPPLVRKKDENDDSSPYIWRTNLGATQKFWQGWFQGLSEKFLTARAAKFLVLAGTDRLDKPLIIGQMQGKFQMDIFADAGHAIHEDQPSRLAQCLVEFWKRNKRLILPPKVPMPPPPKKSS